MKRYDRQNPATSADRLEKFLKRIDFVPPADFLEFLKIYNGVSIVGDEDYIHVWPLLDMVEMSQQYIEDEALSTSYLIVGSNGGTTAYLMEKSSGKIYEIPWLDMSFESPQIVSENFSEFIGNIK